MRLGNSMQCAKVSFYCIREQNSNVQYTLLIVTRATCLFLFFSISPLTCLFSPSCTYSFLLVVYLHFTFVYIHSLFLFLLFNNCLMCTLIIFALNKGDLIPERLINNTFSLFLIIY